MVELSPKNLAREEKATVTTIFQLGVGQNIALHASLAARSLCTFFLLQIFFKYKSNELFNSSIRLLLVLF